MRENALHIGAGTRLAALYDSTIIRDKAAALTDAIHVMSVSGYSQSRDDRRQSLQCLPLRRYARPAARRSMRA